MPKTEVLYMTFRKYTKMVYKEINKTLMPFDLSSQHGNYLIALSDGDGISIKELNDKVDNDGAITTRVLKKLVQSDLISVTKQGAKNSVVFLTKQGKKITKNLLLRIAGTRKKIFSKLSPIEQLQLLKMANKLI